MSSNAENSEMILWEVFTQDRKGNPHEHAGSVHAVDAEMALQNARDVYGRRGELSNVWIVKAESIVASDVGEQDSLFEPSDTKVYRHPQFYKVPRGVKNV